MNRGKILNNRINKKLLFLLSFYFFSFLNLSGQIVYTNVDPDIVVSATDQDPSKQFDLDINKDGTIDFQIRHNKWDVMFQAEIYTARTGEGSEVLSNGNNAALALSNMDAISSAQSNWVSSPSSALFMNFNGASFVGQGDKYIGLKIIINNKKYYGWVRIEIPSDESRIEIKDYAYNKTEGAVINAGQGAIIGINNFFFDENKIFSIYPNPFSDKSTLFIDEKIKTNALKIFVYDRIGQLVKSVSCLNSSTITIERENLSAGVYWYQLVNEDKLIGKVNLVIQ